MRSIFANIFLTGFVLAATATASIAASAEDWRFEKQEDGIEVHTRPVADSGIREFKGRTEVQADVDDILLFLQDSDGYKNWFPNCIDSMSLARDGDVSFRYSVTSTPWPISNRDVVFRTVTRRNENTGVVDIEVSAAPDEYAVQKGLVRVRLANGNWKLEPLEGARTRVTFTMHLEPGGGIPEWLINSRVVGTPLATLSNLRTYVGRSISGEKRSGRQ